MIDEIIDGIVEALEVLVVAVLFGLSSIISLGTIALVVWLLFF